MSKILYAAVNGIPKNPRVKKIQDGEILRDLLTDCGYEVVFENDDDVKIAIVEITQLSSFLNGQLLRALTKVHDIENVIFFTKDFKIHGLMYDVEKMMDYDSFRKQTAKVLYDKKDIVEEDYGRAYRVLQRFYNGEYKVMCPNYAYGDKSIIDNFLNHKGIYHWDLSQLVIDKYIFHYDIEYTDLIYDFNKRENKAFFASINNYSTKIKKFQDYCRMPLFNIGYGKNKLDSELHVFMKQSRYKFAFANEYPVSGSGWFRSRYIYAAYLNQPIIVNHVDKMMHDSFDFDIMDAVKDEDYYNEVADKQRRFIISNMTPKSTLVTQLKDFLS